MRNLLFAMVLSSILGGAIAIGGYVLIVDQPRQDQVLPAGHANPVSFTNYELDTTNYIVPEGLNFVYAAKSATPFVVHIRTTYTGTSEGTARNPMEELFRDYFGDRYDRQQRRGMGAGSGVVITEDGYIATNNHVVEDASEVEVLLNDNRSYTAEVIGRDPDTDLALIKIDAENLPHATFGDSESIQIGEWVLAIGNPFEFRSTVTAGIVSAKARNINILAGRNGGSNTQIEAFIQTDAAVNPGNSGGALVNLKGELVGINTAIASPTGAYAGYSFAVPATLVKKVVFDLKDFGAVQRPLLGIQIVNVSARLAEEEGLDVYSGVYVAEVNAGTAAEEAGLKDKDVIVAINGKEISNVAQLQEQVALNRPGDKIEVTFIRDGKTRTVEAILKNQFKTTEVVKSNGAFKVEGATLEPASGRLKEKLKIESGVQIRSIGEGKWRNTGIKEGFVITKVDRKPVNTGEELLSILESARGQGSLIEGIYPDGEKAYYAVVW